MSFTLACFAMVTIVGCTARNLVFDDPGFSARACEAPTEGAVGLMGISPLPAPQAADD
jgi:hypothetical protein